MYDESTDTPALARNSNLNEELGQVHTLLTEHNYVVHRELTAGLSKASWMCTKHSCVKNFVLFMLGWTLVLLTPS